MDNFYVRISRRGVRSWKSPFRPVYHFGLSGRNILAFRGGAIWWTLTKERQAWCNLQVKLCDPCLRALRYTQYIKWRYINSLPFLYHSCSREFWPITSTYEFDLDQVKMRRHSEYLGHQWSFLSEVMVQTHTHRINRTTRATKVVGYNRRHANSSSCM